MYDGDWLLRLSQLARQVKPAGGWRVPANVWGLGITSLLTDISSEMAISILPAYLVLTSGFTPLVLGIATGLHHGGTILATWVGGLVADRSGKRKLTAGLGYGISAMSRIGWLVFPLPSAGTIAGLVLSDRVGKAIRTAPRDAIISLSAHPSQQATAFGVHRALDAAGAAAGPVLAFVLLWKFPQRFDVIFFTSLVIALLGLAALTLLVEENLQSPTTDRRVTNGVWAEGFALFGDASLRRILLLAGAFGLVTISDAFVYLLLVQRSHAGAHWIPLFYTATAISFLLLAVPVGYLADKFGRQRVFVIGHGTLLLVYLAAAGGFPAWPLNAFVCVVLLGVFYACSEGVLAGLAGGLLPSHVRSTGLAWVATALSGARLCSSVIFGLIWTRAGDRVAVITFAAALAIVVAGFARSSRRPDLNTPIEA